MQAAQLTSRATFVAQRPTVARSSRVQQVCTNLSLSAQMRIIYTAWARLILALAVSALRRDTAPSVLLFAI